MLTNLLKFLEQKKIKVISVIKELVNKNLSTITGKITQNVNSKLNSNYSFKVMSCIMINQLRVS